jgi:hypothetical protein
MMGNAPAQVAAPANPASSGSMYPGIAPYQPPFGSPYPYTNNPSVPNPYYRSPYSYGYRTPYGYGVNPVNAFQPYGSDYYGLAFGGRDLRFWRASSGYYYPWVPGFGYTTYPIFMVPQGQSNPAAALPPISVLVNDLGDYLDKAKEKGKVSDNDFLSLKRRANDLLSKEKSLAYEAGGSLDADQEADIRRDVDELSGEVARRVRP